MASPEEIPSPAMESRLIKELSTVPVVQTIKGYYDQLKSFNRILDFGLTYVETGICTAVGNVAKNTWAGSTIDQYAGDRLEGLKTRYPILQKAPEKIMRKTKRKTMRRVQKGAATVFDTRVGKLFTSGLDTAVNMSEKTLVRLQPPAYKSPEKVEEHTDVLKSEKPDETKEQETETLTKEQQTDISGEDISKNKMKIMAKMTPLMRFRKFLLEVFLFPLEVMVEFLKSAQTFTSRVNGSVQRRKSTRKIRSTGLTPEKRIEIESRRKVSPKKRIQSSLFGNIKKVTFQLLGMEKSTSKQSDIRDFIKCSKHKGLNYDPALAGDDSEKKRKHDDIETEGSLSTDEEKLMDMDLEEYDSADDPDFDPTDSSCSDVSIGSVASESDLEVEMTDEPPLVQLKEKDTDKSKEDKKAQLAEDGKGLQNDKPQSKPEDKLNVNGNVEDKVKKNEKQLKSDDKVKIVGSTENKSHQSDKQESKAEDKKKISETVDGKSKVPTTQDTGVKCSQGKAGAKDDPKSASLHDGDKSKPKSEYILPKQPPASKTPDQFSVKHGGYVQYSQSEKK